MSEAAAIAGKTPRPANPRVYTKADLSNGEDVILTAMRADSHAYHTGAFAYPARYLEEARLAVVTENIGHGAGKRGDIVLRIPADHADSVTIWDPRSLSVVLMAECPDMIKEVN
jgi:hypothetical protein